MFCCRDVVACFVYMYCCRDVAWLLSVHASLLYMYVVG